MTGCTNPGPRNPTWPWNLRARNREEARSRPSRTTGRTFSAEAGSLFIVRCR